MKYNFKLLQKATKPELEELLQKLKTDIHILENEQAQNREAVRMAMNVKDVVNIISLSKDISYIRRMPNGLRELNSAIAEIYKLLYKFLPW